MIIYGWGKITYSMKGIVMRKTCLECNTTLDWQLCVMRTWFTLFFIPIIPYRTKYCIVCPHCRSYIAISKEKYAELKEGLQYGIDAYRFAGKTETQINFIREQERSGSQTIGDYDRY